MASGKMGARRQLQDGGCSALGPEGLEDSSFFPRSVPRTLFVFIIQDCSAVFTLGAGSDTHIASQCSPPSPPAPLPRSLHGLSHRRDPKHKQLTEQDAAAALYAVLSTATLASQRGALPIHTGRDLCQGKERTVC